LPYLAAAASTCAITRFKHSEADIVKNGQRLQAAECRQIAAGNAKAEKGKPNQRLAAQASHHRCGTFEHCRTVQKTDHNQVSPFISHDRAQAEAMSELCDADIRVLRTEAP
jgi:hypothetical protein